MNDGATVRNDGAPMKYYALTFPQLVAQAMELRLGDGGIGRLRAGYDLAERMADGLYRSQGCPFLNHLVRTSSIVLAHGGSLTQCLAAMLHSAYMLDCFQYSRRRAFRMKDRGELAEAVGGEVEEIVWEYSHTGWGSSERISVHLGKLHDYGPVPRSVLLARLANELEDYLDLAVQYRPRYEYRKRIDAFGGLCIELAERLGYPDLGLALRGTYDAALSCQIPVQAVRKYIDAYELPPRHYHEMNPVAYAVTRAGRLIRKLRRQVTMPGLRN